MNHNSLYAIEPFMEDVYKEGMIKSIDVHSNICTFFDLHPIYFYRYLCYNVRKGQKKAGGFSRCSARACYLVLFSPQKSVL